jgi:hypothetical protein
MTLRGCALHWSGVSRWVQVPGRPMLDRNRQLVFDDRGKVKYIPLLEWDDEDVRLAFSAAAVAAIELFDPGIFIAE